MRIGGLPLAVTRIKTTGVPAESSLDFSPRKGRQGSLGTPQRRRWPCKPRVGSSWNTSPRRCGSQPRGTWNI